MIVIEWIEIKVITSKEALEAVTAVMHELGSGGLYIEDPTDIPDDFDYIDENFKGAIKTVVHGYFNSIDIDKKVGEIEEKLIEIKSFLNIGEGKIEVCTIDEEDYANCWKKYYKPVKISEKIVVKPTWEDYDGKEDIIINLDPGMAFGTGTHETTRLCIKLIEKYLSTKINVLDIGTGSGILSVSAMKLGAGSALAVDIDPNSAKIAKENGDINNVTIKTIAGNVFEMLKNGEISGDFDMVIANIVADVIIPLCSEIKTVIKKGGIGIFSGIITSRIEDVKAKLEENGFEIVDLIEEGEWAAFAGRYV